MYDTTMTLNLSSLHRGRSQRTGGMALLSALLFAASLAVVTFGAGCDAVAQQPAEPAPSTVDADSDGVTANLDCDDENAAVRPGAVETCDGVDTDCDPLTEPAGAEVDIDGDGVPSCNDCDDTDAAVAATCE
ncbi:MAG: putative metal-binding motif-containing protein [Deltaproteobacteria bacterium]|nr:putative metal-binding motif-containing protein [Deltaproteobacteria bacterium]